MAIGAALPGLLFALTGFEAGAVQTADARLGIDLAFAIVLGAQTLWAKITGEAVEGFTTIILLLLIIGAVLMIALGIIGQYLSKIYDEVKRRPRYLIRGSVPERPTPADEKGETVQSRRGGERVS